MTGRAVHLLATLGVAGSALLLVGCRDGADLYRPDPRAPLQGSSWRLTYNLGWDLHPSWTPEGEVIYSAESFPPFPPTAGVLLRLEPAGGEASQVLPSVQPSSAISAVWLMAPGISPDGSRLAFVTMNVVDTLIGCGGQWSCVGPPAFWSQFPPLTEAHLYVRELNAVGPLAADPRSVIRFRGRSRDETQHPANLAFLTLWDIRPFQVEFLENRTAVFRPSWAPDGERLVFSDGEELNLWDLSTGQQTRLPRTAGGVSPAWSPTGDWIAYARLQPGSASTFRCSCINRLGLPVEVVERTVYLPRPASLVLARPDGSESIELGEGNYPAWSPDGSSLYFVREERIWRMPAQGGEAQPIPGTEGGLEPAVSPDGALLAFTRPSVQDGSDIWIVSLSASP